MKIEQISHGSWPEAWRCALGSLELIVATSIGPRIVSLRHAGGPNFLFEDPQGGIASGDWHLWGGHRFWVAPETKTTYYPDNHPNIVSADGNTLRITSPEEQSGLQKTIEISPCAASGGFRIRHRLTNNGPMLAYGAVWALSCVLPTGTIVAPWGEGSPDREDAGGWRTQMIRFWRRWGGSAVSAESMQYHLRNDHLRIQPTGETGKIGLFSDAGLLAQLRPEGTFIKCGPPRPEGQYPDGGCNLEIYTCGSFIELETLGPLGVLHKGQTLVHDEHWLLTPQVFKPEQWPRLLELMNGVLNPEP